MWLRIVGYVAYRGLVSGMTFGLIIGALWGVPIGGLAAILICAVLGVLVGMIIGSLICGITGFCIILIIRIRFYPPLNHETYARRLRATVVITSMVVTLICVGIIMRFYATSSLTIGETLWNTLLVGFLPAVYAGVCAAYFGNKFVNFAIRELELNLHPGHSASIAAYPKN